MSELTQVIRYVNNLKVMSYMSFTNIVRFQARDRSTATSVQRPSPTSQTCAPTSRPTPAASRLNARAVARHLLSSRTSASTRRPPVLLRQSQPHLLQTHDSEVSYILQRVYLNFLTNKFMNTTMYSIKSVKCIHTCTKPEKSCGFVPLLPFNFLPQPPH